MCGPNGNGTGPIQRSIPTSNHKSDSTRGGWVFYHCLCPCDPILMCGKWEHCLERLDACVPLSWRGRPLHAPPYKASDLHLPQIILSDERPLPCLWPPMTWRSPKQSYYHLQWGVSSCCPVPDGPSPMMHLCSLPSSSMRHDGLPSSPVCCHGQSYLSISMTQLHLTFVVMGPIAHCLCGDCPN